MKAINQRRVVIIDDHDLARDELRYQLNTYHPDFEVVGDFPDPNEALPIIEAGQVEGIFLDINFEELGETLGLEFANRISHLPQAPWIIFLSKHPEYALDAIEIRPFGFITKPFDYRKLAIALDKVCKAFVAVPQSPAAIGRIEVRHRTTKLNAKGDIERLFIIRFLHPEEIMYIQTEQGMNCVKVHLSNTEVLKEVNIKLKDWLDLKMPSFIQIHKSSIVNLRYVSGFKPNSERDDGHVLLFKENLTELPIGETYFAAFKEAIRRP